jgi:hypothetical protein
MSQARNQWKQPVKWDAYVSLGYVVVLQLSPTDVVLSV